MFWFVINIRILYAPTHIVLSLLATQPSLLPALFTLQLFARVRHCEERCQHAAQEKAGEGYTGPPQLSLSKYLHHHIPSPGIVLEQSFQLEHGTHWQKHVEDLVTVAQKVAVTWEEALGNGEGEKDGGQQEGGNLEGVEVQWWCLYPGHGEEAVDYGAYVQNVRQGGGDQLADFTL